ncbi:MAG: peptidylprolyl isomerase [Bryobacteraceae bacterium]
MKYFPAFIFTAMLWAQSAAPPAQSPNHAVAHFDVGAHLAASVTPETVIATFDDGQKLTAGELNSFLAAMPPNMAEAARRDKRGFVQQFAMMHHLSEMAEKAKLDEQSPTREAVAFNRMYLLMNAQLHEVLSGLTVPAADVQKYYDEKKERFKQVKVKAIYIPFSDQPAASSEPKKLTPAEAQAKISKLRADIAGGADFVKLVKENSQDEISRTKDGDFGTMRSTDNLPQPIRTAIFALKAGEVSQPVKEPNGFYLFRAEEVTTQPLADVQETIVNDLKQAEFKTWMDNLQKSINLKIENEGYFVESGGPAPAGK